MHRPRAIAMRIRGAVLVAGAHRAAGRRPLRVDRARHALADHALERDAADVAAVVGATHRQFVVAQRARESFGYAIATNGLRLGPVEGDAEGGAAGAAALADVVGVAHVGAAMAAMPLTGFPQEASPL